MAGVAHDVLVADALVIGCGDEADAQRVGAEAIEPLHGDPGHLDATGKNPAHGVGMQRRVADAVAGADAAERRAGAAFGDRLPGVERPHRTGFGVSAAAGRSPPPARPGPSWHE